MALDLPLTVALVFCSLNVRSELPALMADDVEYDEGYDQMDKRNLASLARNNFFPSRPSRNVAAMAKNNLFRKGHNLGKRFDEEGKKLRKKQ